jgi:hypothetical protein
MLSDDFKFHLGQVEKIKLLMEDLPAFRPDGRTPLQIQALVTAAETVYRTFREADIDLNLAQGRFEDALTQGHQICLQVYPIMKSRYRGDPQTVERILQLPVRDQTPPETETRLAAIVVLWASMPLPPEALTPFVAWEGMGLVQFSVFLTNLRAEILAQPGNDQIFQAAEAALGNMTAQLADVATAALIQGRAQFPDGTASREAIDSIPVLPASKRPGQAVVQASSPAAGEVRVDYHAPHGTSFDVWRKGPGDAALILVADGRWERNYSATNLPAGGYEFQVIARNSRGEGEGSAVVTVVVG